MKIYKMYFQLLNLDKQSYDASRGKRMERYVPSRWFHNEFLYVTNMLFMVISTNAQETGFAFTCTRYEYLYEWYSFLTDLNCSYLNLITLQKSS